MIHEVLRHLLFSGLQFYFLVVILIQKTTFTIVPYIISPEMSDVFCLLTKLKTSTEKRYKTENCANLVELNDVLDEEAVGVVPGQENLFQDCFDPLLGEVEVVGLHQGRVYQVQPHRIGSKLVAHLNWVGVVLEPL